MAYDRLLERLYLVDEGWIIKGATALLARDRAYTFAKASAMMEPWPGSD
jgi:hypothetical protein